MAKCKVYSPESYLLNLKRFTSILPERFEKKLDKRISHKFVTNQRSERPDLVYKVSQAVFPTKHEKEERLLCVLEIAPTKRRYLIDAFAQHLCIVYDYQLGHLKSYNDLHITAGYVVDVIIDSIATGVIGASLTPEDGLHPGLFFHEDCPMPYSSYSDVLDVVSKTFLNIDMVRWCVRDLFTQPGLRYTTIVPIPSSDSGGGGVIDEANPIDDADSDTISIEAKLLSPYTRFGQARNPALYGFRNIVVYPQKEKESDIYRWNLLFQDAATIARASCHASSSIHFLMKTEVNRSIFALIYLGDQQTIDTACRAHILNKQSLFCSTVLVDKKKRPKINVTSQKLPIVFTPLNEIAELPPESKSHFTHLDIRKVFSSNSFEESNSDITPYIVRQDGYDDEDDLPRTWRSSSMDRSFVSPHKKDLDSISLVSAYCNEGFI